MNAARSAAGCGVRAAARALRLRQPAPPSAGTASSARRLLSGDAAGSGAGSASGAGGRPFKHIDTLTLSSLNRFRVRMCIGASFAGDGPTTSAVGDAACEGDTCELEFEKGASRRRRSCAPARLRAALARRGAGGGAQPAARSDSREDHECAAPRTRRPAAPAPPPSHRAWRAQASCAARASAGWTPAGCGCGGGRTCVGSRAAARGRR